MLGQPPDDLDGGAILGSVVRIGDLGVQRRRHRPGLRSVDRDLDEPHRVVVVAEPASDLPGLDVISGDPLLVRRAVHVPARPDVAALGDKSLRELAPLGQVVVVGPGAIGLDVVARSGGRFSVDLHAAVHPNHVPSVTVSNHVFAGHGLFLLLKFLACVPLT